jgi:hypothetical protein
MLKGFGIVFGVEPASGSQGGGTEIHITGAGFAYVTQVLIGGTTSEYECLIFFPSVKDGELTCYTPPGTGNQDVELVFTSGHRAKWRSGSFSYQSDYTPYLRSNSLGAPVLNNLTLDGDFKKVLEGNQEFMFHFLTEKRNATEIMHVYIGPGTEVFADKAGIGEYRCDLIETPSQQRAICEVRAGTPAGFYNLTYVLEDGGTGMGYGKAKIEMKQHQPNGGKAISMTGVEYMVEIIPTLHRISQRRAGRLGGSKLDLIADALDPAKQNFASRHTVLLDGVPCIASNVVKTSSQSSGFQDKLSCETQDMKYRSSLWPTLSSQPALGPWLLPWTTRVGLSTRPEYQPGVGRNWPESNLKLLHVGAECVGNYDRMDWTSTLEHCADHCFRIGTCKHFWYRPDFQDCRWCMNMEASNIEFPGSGDRRRRQWAPEIGGGIYEFAQTGEEYLESNGKTNNWELINVGKRCDVTHWISWGNSQKFALGVSVQECADYCMTTRLTVDGGYCQYFGMFREIWDGNPTRCVIYEPAPLGGNYPPKNEGPRCTEADLVEDKEWSSRYNKYNTYKITKPVPHSPQPTNLFPGGRGVMYRVWNACPRNSKFFRQCWNRQTPFQALYGGLNPDYREQKPMFEGIRADILRGPFGNQPDIYSYAHSILPFDQSVPYATLAEASDNHGLVFELIGWFVAPFTANYSFLVWGNQMNDMWMSTSSKDPTRQIKIAEYVEGGRCNEGLRTGDNPHSLLGCSVFEDLIDEGTKNPWTGAYYRHQGNNFTDSFGWVGQDSVGGMRTPTLHTMGLQKDERRLFVRRVAFQEDSSKANSRRRRRFADGVGVHIHKPDMSNVSTTVKASLAETKSWPTILKIRREKGKDGGQWHFVITDPNSGTSHNTQWMDWNTGNANMRDQWNAVTLSTGKTAWCEDWYLSEDATHYNYMLVVWRPHGNVGVGITTNNMRSEITVQTVWNGNSQDLFVFPIPGQWLEAPALEPQSQLRAVDLGARHADSGANSSLSSVSSTSSSATADANGTAVDPYAAEKAAAPQPTGSSVFPCQPNDAASSYRYYRLTVYALDTSGNDLKLLEIGEVQFFSSSGELVRIDGNSVTSSVNFKTAYPLGNLVDGDYYTYAKSDDSVSDGSFTEVVLTFDFQDNATAVDFFGFVGGSATQYDPARWKLEAANDLGGTWTDVITAHSVNPVTYMSDTRNVFTAGYANEIGRSNCGIDASGCTFGQTFYGSSSETWTVERLDDSWSLGKKTREATWLECLQRCCYEDQCRSASWDSTTEVCTPNRGAFEPSFIPDGSGTKMIANVLTKGDSRDGYGFHRHEVYYSGLPVAQYEGHRSVKFCKEACDASSQCQSFTYHADHGCTLKTACVTSSSYTCWKSYNCYFAQTYYKLWPTTTCEDYDSLTSVTYTWLNLTNRTAQQISEAHGGVASRAIDGNYAGDWNEGSCTHTSQETNPWWEVDLGMTTKITAIRLSNRADCCGGRTNNFAVWTDGQLFSSGNQISDEIKIFPMKTSARVIRIIVPNTILNFCEFGVTQDETAGVTTADELVNPGATTAQLASKLNPEGSQFNAPYTAPLCTKMNDVWFYDGSNKITGIEMFGRTRQYQLATFLPSTNESQILGYDPKPSGVINEARRLAWGLLPEAQVRRLSSNDANTSAANNTAIVTTASVTTTNTSTTTATIAAANNTAIATTASVTTTNTSTTTATIAQQEQNTTATVTTTNTSTTKTTIAQQEQNTTIVTTVTTSTTTNMTTTTNSTTTTTIWIPVRLALQDGTYINSGDAIDTSAAGVVGRVEIEYSGQWGTICKDQWGIKDAQVVCKQLGYNFGIVAQDSDIPAVADNAMPIWLDDVHCQGLNSDGTSVENHLGQCGHSGWGVHNCYHTEDVGANCRDVTTTTTTTTSTTTTTLQTNWADVTQTPIRGYIRNKLTGKCVDVDGSPGVSDGLELKTVQCEFHYSNNDHEWELTPNGFIFHPLSGKCMDVSGVPANGASEGLQVYLRYCNTTVGSLEYFEHRWMLSESTAGEKYYIRSQLSGKCLDATTNNAVVWNTCDMTEGAVNYQRWEFVEKPTTHLKTGFLRQMRGSARCLDVEGFPFPNKDATIDIRDCQYFHGADVIDQLWELTADDELKNKYSGYCLTVGDSSNIFLNDCDNSTSQKWYHDAEYRMRSIYNGECLDVSGSSTNNGDDVGTYACTTDLTSSSGTDHQWEWVEHTQIEGICCGTCSNVTDATLWSLDTGLKCRCRYNTKHFRYQRGYAAGMLDSYEPPYLEPVPKTSVRSSLADLFIPLEGLTADNESSVAFTTPLGFDFLSEQEQPYVSKVTVNGAETLSMNEGDELTLWGGNFDDLDNSSVEVYLEDSMCEVTDVYESHITCVVPAATYANISLMVRAGWKGWVNMGPVVEPLGTPRISVNVTFGGGSNVITSISPTAGSVLGGTRLIISGNGFWTNNSKNVIQLRRRSGSAVELVRRLHSNLPNGAIVGTCRANVSSLGQIECILPQLDRSHWSSTQTAEYLTLVVNGIDADSVGVDLVYQYASKKTPRVLSVTPNSLSYAVTGNLTLTGQNFGLLTRETTVTFGDKNRPCRIWSVTQTQISCQLLRSAMAEPPLCTDISDVYNVDCIVKPTNFRASPTVLITSKGYAEAMAASVLDTRFEIHSVSPSVGSEEGGAVVTIRGVGFGTTANQIMVAALGTTGDYFKWTPTEIIFRSNKARLNTALVDVQVNLIVAEHKCGAGETHGDCNHAALYLPETYTPQVTAVTPITGRSGDTVSLKVTIPPSAQVLKCTHYPIKASTNVERCEGGNNLDDGFDYFYNTGRGGDGAVCGDLDCWCCRRDRVSADDVTVTLGDYLCSHNSTDGQVTRTGDQLDISCKVPEFEASVVDIKVLLFPYGFAKFPLTSGTLICDPAYCKFTHQLVIDSVTPNSGSIAGRKVVIAGAGFSDHHNRHFVSVGYRDQIGFGYCEPVMSNYHSLTCILNYGANEGHSSSSWSAARDITVTKWDTEVWSDPMAAFGRSAVGCMKNNDALTIWTTFSATECAVNCLTYRGCVSFDFRPRQGDCRLSTSSFTGCSACEDQKWLDCRYYELRTEADSTLAIVTTKSNAFTFNTEMTPDIQVMFVLPGSNPGNFSRDGPGFPMLPAIDPPTGCGADNPAGLAAGNDACCSSLLHGAQCGVNEGKCTNNNQCVGELECLDYGCSWSYGSNDDKCCSLQGKDTSYPMRVPMWAMDDEVVLRVRRLGTVDYANNHASDQAVVDAVATPGNGHVKVTFDGVLCPVQALRKSEGADDWYDIACKVGEVPGGMVQQPLLEVATLGRARGSVDVDPGRDDIWIVLPLDVSGVSAPEIMSLAGGWTLNISGYGFAQPASAGADSYVQVDLCGKECVVTKGTYSSIECTTPKILTPDYFSTTSPFDQITVEDAKVVSEGAGYASVLSPSCIHGIMASHYETNAPVCASVFDSDTELTGGLANAGCWIGLDYGAQTNVRIEKIRFHPMYDNDEADKYVNSVFEYGTLDSTQPCDELTMGHRGDAYRGCQTVSTKGKMCENWEDRNKNLVARVPELGGHNYCRNPQPRYRYGPWCYVKDGGVQYCQPKAPAITWTTINTITSTPKLLWNTVELTTPVTGRFVRFFSAQGNCRFTEMQVIGHKVSASNTCQVSVRNARRAPGKGLKLDNDLPLWLGGGSHAYGHMYFPHATSDWATTSSALISYVTSTTPVILTMDPNNGTIRGGTTVTLTGDKLCKINSNSGQCFSSNVADLSVKFNGYPCAVQTYDNDGQGITCITSERTALSTPSIEVDIAGIGLAVVNPPLRWRYLDRWSELRTWGGDGYPIVGDAVIVPVGQALMVDQDTPALLLVVVEGELVFEDAKDLTMTAQYIWVKGGTFEIGTESMPFMHRLTITLTGEKYDAIRLPVIGAKCLAVSNEHFTVREFGDFANEPGRIGTLDIHGAPRRKVWTRLAETAEAGSTEIVLQDRVDFKAGEEIMLVATSTPHKHMSGNGLHGAPPTDFEDERAIVAGLGTDRKTVTLTAPLKYTHISTYYIRSIDNEYIDLSGEVALLTRNVKIQGDDWNSEKDSWGGHTMMAFGGYYRIENAEFYRMGQTGELSRYPIHFHVSQHWGRWAYAKHNSIHHSFQRAVAIHGTDYVTVLGNVGFEIIGHMFFIETGMEKMNHLEGNLGVGAIPLLSGMLESDQEPAGFWTAAPNNVWIDNVAATGSDGWYFQLPGTPISHSIDVYKDSICPVADRVGQWRRNRCHHTTGTCIRVYLTWKPTKDPCNPQSGEAPQLLFNTTCWGVGNNCFNTMKGGATVNHHMTAIEGGNQDFVFTLLNRGGTYDAAKWPVDYIGPAYIKDSEFVGILPQNLATNPSQKWKASSIEMPQDETFNIVDSTWVNYRHTPALMDCSACWSSSKWRQGAYTYEFSGLNFINTTKRIFVHKKGIFHDMDGTLTGTPDSYTTWADAHNQIDGSCTTIQAPFKDWPDLGMGMAASTLHDSGGTDESDGMFHIMQNPASLIHSRRNYSHITCTKPLRKFEIAYPEPAEVYLRQLMATNKDTQKTHIFEYEYKEIFGWTFPVVANSRIAVRPNLAGLDFLEGSVRYAYSDLLKRQKQRATDQKVTFNEEWFQVTFNSFASFHHYNLKNPDWEMLANRRGAQEGERIRDKGVSNTPYLGTGSSVLDTPAKLSNMQHGMIDDRNWAATIRYPYDEAKSKVPMSEEPLSFRFEAKYCPEEGCPSTIPEFNDNFTHCTPWSSYVGATDTTTAVVIPEADCVTFDMEGTVEVLNLTIKGKLTFDDTYDRVLETNNIVVWGILQIGTSTHPFGLNNGTNPITTATIRLRGSVMDIDTYVYIEEQTLHNKGVYVPGKVETFGAPLVKNWLRLKNALSSGATSACLISDTDPMWPLGSEIVIAPTEYNANDHVESRTLTHGTTYDSVAGCYNVHWDSALSYPHYAGDVQKNANGDTVSLRAVVARIDRTVRFESKTIDGSNYYGGHFEVFEIAGRGAGSLSMYHTRFHQLGKGGISAGVKVGFASVFTPPPSIVFDGCSFTNSLAYALHTQSTNVPVIIKDNVFTNVEDAGIYIDTGCQRVQMVNNAVIGVSRSPLSPVMTNEFTGGVRVANYAGIRTDVVPVRMIGNVVFGSGDIGFLHRLEPCPPTAIFDNEACASVIGVHLLPQKSGTCQTVSLYKIWKAAHMALFMADTKVGATQLNSITVSDSHMGIVPYMSIGKAFRRLFLNDCTIMGTTPASSCSYSTSCRSMSDSDPTSQNCNSAFGPLDSTLYRVGYTSPLNTGYSKTCDVTMDPRQCRQLSPAFINMECNFPLETHNHFDRGLGWAFF